MWKGLEHEPEPLVFSQIVRDNACTPSYMPDMKILKYNHAPNLYISETINSITD